MKTNELISDVSGEGMIAPDSEMGIKLGFTSDKFDGWLWQKGKVIWISFIESREEGKGNFKALLDKIEELGYGIVVPTPFSRMGLICIKRGMKYSEEIPAGDEFTDGFISLPKE